MADNIFGTKRNIDMVFCIDGTSRMASCIESVKTNVQKFHLECVSVLTDFGSEIDSTRIKIIVFRDYLYDGEHAIVESPFFNLPAEEVELSAYLDGIKASGGYGESANGLEALYLAMKSDFCAGSKDIQVIALFTNGDALELKRRAHKRGYPKDMVDEVGLIETWACMAQDPDFKLRERNKRLVIFAPDGTKYKGLKSKLNRSVFVPVNKADDFNNINFGEIVKLFPSSAAYD